MVKNKLNILAITLFAGILFSCSFVQNKDKKEEVEEQIIQNNDTLSFMEMISSIPKIKLPYNLYCGIESNRFSLAEDFGKDFEKTMPENSIIVGRLPIDNDNIYILYGLSGDIIYPYLNIYDKNGHKIDSLYLHIGYCAGDEEEIKSTATTINKDFSIQMVDTTRYISFDENDEIITDSIIVSTRKMNLMKDGRYKMIKETTYKVE